MTGQQVVKRLRAFEKGKPLPLGETLRVPRLPAKDVLIVCFVRMGGESAPWGIAFGYPGKAPTVLSVGEPRNRDLVADMVAEFAPVLLKHLQHPSYGGPWADSGEQLEHRQVWVPNATHLDMFHHLAYAYTFTKFGSAKRVELLNQFGRAAGWLFREAQRPGQMIAVVASEALKQSYTFPAEDIRQGHLGYLLAWLRTSGGRDKRMARAEEEERRSVATSLNPDEEREQLENRVDAFNEARGKGDEKAQTRRAKEIDEVIGDALRRRFKLTEQAIELLRDDPRRPNEYLSVLVKASLDEQWRQYLRIEKRFEDPDDGPPYVPSPETDRNPAAAASRYLIYEASQDLLENLLVHDDKELQAELIAEGRAIRGRILSVEDEDPSRKTVPIWIVESDGTLPLKLREGNDVCVVGCRNRQGDTREIERTKERKYHFEVQITSCVTVPRGNTKVLRATSPKLVGQKVTLVPVAKDGISRSKSRKVWNKDVPGKKLTHLRPSGIRTKLPDEVLGEKTVES